VGVTILRITPHPSYYCCGFGLEAVGVLLLLCTSLLLLGDVSKMSSALLSIEGLLNHAALLGIAGLLSLAEL
jgi:hypothetical protein